MMREKIGRELIRWNTTRFGTVFIFSRVFGIDKISSSNGWYLMTGRNVCGLVRLTMISHMIV